MNVVEVKNLTIMSQADMSGASANSSDFVKKLYKMLEDKTHEDVVRWGNEGDSFVVLENEKFTKSILPKNFKHSNFASFVRQLNKYDFHKVRQTNEDNGQSPYGPGAWEFKHPEFQADKKEALDNIRRKAPAPRKANSSSEDVTGTMTQMDLMNTQLAGTQHQLQFLSEKYEELTHTHVQVMQQVIQLQKIVKNHDGVMHRVMGFLHQVDEQRRSSLRGGSFANGNSSGMGISDLVVPGQDDHPASPLQQAQQLLGEFPADRMIDSRDLEARAVEYSFLNNYATPPDQSGSTTMAPTSGGSSAQLGFATINHHPPDLENLVYPMGHSNGIDPIDSEHIHNIPYSLPSSNGVLPINHANEMMIKSESEKRKKAPIDPGWTRKPRILLVEDDNTCARIGMKFLTAFDCTTEIAHDGLEAVNKISVDPNYDLILMDIIMPNLDGVSATSCIRQSNSASPDMPIIAMTSNIRSEDIDMYFRYGMNEVLPKPFTKEGMLRILEKQLAHLKKSYPNQPVGPIQQPNLNFATPNGASGPLNLNLTHISSSLKDEASPGKSPASSWHSPNQIGASPQSQTQQHFGQPMSAGGYVLTPTHAVVPGIGVGTGNAHSHFHTPTGRPGPQQQQHRRQLSDMSDMMNPVEEHLDVKRQRMYPPHPAGFP